MLFDKGDIVELRLKPHPGRSADFSHKWNNLRCEVIKHFSPGHKPYLRPLVKRPDGAGYHEFYWDVSELELLSMPDVDEESYEID